MKSKKNSHYTNKTQSEIFNISQLSVQQLRQALLTNPSLINTIDNNGETLLSYALKKNNYKTFDLLLNSPFLYLNFQDRDGNSYLHLSVKNQNEKIIKNLIEKGINLNLQNKLGNTALHIAYEIGNNNIIKFLIEHGINRIIKNKENKKAEEIKSLTMNKNQSVHNYNSICKTMINNKSTSEFKINNVDTNILKSAKKEDNKDIYDINKRLQKENGGIYEEDIRSKVYSKINKNPKFIIKKNNPDKKIGTNESGNNNSNLTVSEERKNKKDLNIKIDFEKFKKGSLYKISLKDKNNTKVNKEEELFEYNNITDNRINYTDRGNKIITNIDKKMNNLGDSSSSYLESSDSRKKNANIKRLSTQINSINESEFMNPKDNNKRKKNTKRTNFRNDFYNLGNINDIEKWNTMQLRNSPNKIKIKNKDKFQYKPKGSLTKKNSPKKDISSYSNKTVNKTMNKSKSKNKNVKKISISKDFMVNKKNKKNLNEIERYFNEDINEQLNIEEEKVKRLEQKEYAFEDEVNLDIIDDIPNSKSFKNSIISINKLNNEEEKDNFLNFKPNNLLKDFLFQINMDKHLAILANNGFDDINLILEQSKNGGTSIQDYELKEAGISIPGDRAKILIRIQELSNNFPFPVPKEVYHTIEDINKIENDEHIQKLNKWLKNLKVEDYLINFIYSGYHSVELLLMQMISYNPLTSEMLKEEIGIDKIGYRSRIISKLKDEAKGFLGQLTTKTLVINRGGETNPNNCQCIVF